MTEILPQNNSYLIGQKAAEQLFLRAWKSQTMHHAWILSGPKGIGKATLAYRIARFLFAADEANNTLQMSDNSPIFQQVANGSYPDLMVLERDYIETDRKKILSAIKKGEALGEEELAGMRRSAYIRVDDVRKVTEFLSKTSFNDGWRVVIIDSADDMNKSSANALLKILEEPPVKTVLLLISHNMGTLLPTIRSRCAKLPLQTLSVTEVASLLRRYRPELDEKMIAKLAEMSGGSIGKAILYADVDAVKIYDDLCALFYAKQCFKTEKMLDFCTQIAANEDKFAIMEELIAKFIKDNLSVCSDFEALYQCYEESKHMFADCVNVNMDKRLMLINLLSSICKVL
jgi:DNA polymerase-3 subunit delta'